MISAQLAQILRWALPPLLGAVIGYVTNALAIRMLFRPLVEKRILGFRVPLTPGVIPRQRRELAESIGKMVSEHLITEETIDEHLAGESFRRGLRQGISSATERLLSRTPRDLQTSTAALVDESLLDVTGSLLGGFFRSRGFLGMVRALVTRTVSELGARPLSTAAAPEQVKSFVSASVVPLLTTGRDRLVTAFSRWLDRHLTANTPMAQLLPSTVSVSVAKMVDALLPPGRRALLKWLRTPSVQVEIATRGRFLIKDILDKLNIFQKFFISMGQYDRTLDEKMPEIVTDLVDYIDELLHDPSVVTRIRNGLGQAVESLRGQGMADVEESTGLDWRSRVPAMLAELLSHVDPERLHASLGRMIDRFFEANGERTLRELAGRYLNIQETEAVDTISVILLDYLTRESAGQSIARNALELLNGLSSQGSGPESVGEILGIARPTKERLDGFLFQRAHGILTTRLPGFVQGFDIRQMVVDRINRLDVARVEDLLMLVIRRHLKWINVFGAMLGALIGLSQSVVSLFL